MLPVAAEQTGIIQVVLDYGIQADNVEVTLYPAAEAVEGGYRLGDMFGGGLIRESEVFSPDLALWLSQRTFSGGIEKTADELGSVEFAGLEKGLYLLVQTRAPEGWGCAAPFLVPVPLDGEWEILSRPKQSQLLTRSPKTSQHPAPLFGAMGLVLSGMGLYFCLEKIRRK